MTSFILKTIISALLLRAQWTFPPARALSALSTVVAYFLMAALRKRFGYQI